MFGEEAKTAREVEPGRRKVVDARVAGHPVCSLPERVEDPDGEGGVHPLVDLAQEAHEVPRPMLLLGLRNDLAGRDVSAAKRSTVPWRM